MIPTTWRTDTKREVTLAVVNKYNILRGVAGKARWRGAEASAGRGRGGRGKIVFQMIIGWQGRDSALRILSCGDGCRLRWLLLILSNWSLVWPVLIFFVCVSVSRILIGRSSGVKGLAQGRVVADFFFCFLKGT